MPDSDVDKPGTSSPPHSGGQTDSAPVDDSIEDELDRLLSEIDAAVEELDPTGELEDTAAEVRADAQTAPTETDENEELFEVIVPEQSQSDSSAKAGHQDESAADHVAKELDDLIDRAEQEPPNAEPTQIDQELDSLLAEAESLLETEESHAAAGTVEPAVAAEIETEPQSVEEATVDEPQSEAAEPMAEAADAVIEPESEPEDPASAASAEAEASQGSSDARSIEDLDADLAERADRAVDAEQDAFVSSDEVVDEVIEEHASAVEAMPQHDQQDTDDLAMLMAESPASADLGTNPRPDGEPRPKKPQPDPVGGSADATPASDAPNAPTETAAGPKPPSKVAAFLASATKSLEPLALRSARTVSKPLEFVPPRVRDDIGWLASVTLFLAIVVLIALALFR